MKVALFDLDGVIVDTEGAYTIFWEAIGREYRPDVPDLAYVIKGTTLSQIYDKYFPDPEVRAVITKKIEDYERDVPYVLFPGVVDYLKAIRAYGVRTAIVTSSNTRKMESLFAQQPGLRDLFDVIVTDEHVTHSKPHPEPYQIGAQMLGTDATDAVVFEDSYNGLRSGRAAGAVVVALSTSNPAESLAPLADMVVAELSQVPLYIFE